ncbi:MAG: hypothetical protein ACE5HS_19890 [bacterium]
MTRTSYINATIFKLIAGFLLIHFSFRFSYSQASNSPTGGISLFNKQTELFTDSLRVVYSLDDSLLIVDSEEVWADSLRLQKGVDYSIDYVAGILTLKSRPPAKIKLIVKYQKFPVKLRTKYFHREKVLAEEEKQNKNNRGGNSGNKPAVLKPVSQGNFTANLRKNGSITRGITVGTDQGLQVDSGLRMQIAGRLAKNVEVVASLTDQNTPLQPEGNTQTLQEIDKVFVRIKGPNLQATLGDYNLHFLGTEFTQYSRKLQGIMGTVEFQNTTVTLSGAVSKGRFTTNEFLGQEGNQGPYQLTGDKGQINILVLAGTERVWIDGELMTRGENHDYVIEYGNGQITFTRNRLITADSRITVDFQFSDESFQRNLWGLRGETRFLNDKVNLQTTLIRESDDKNNLLGGVELNDDFVQSLEEAGDSTAVAPGWTFVGADSGSYIRDSTGVFVFVGSKAGDYRVQFSFFGNNKGDYRNIGLGRFEYVGENQGSYRPFIILPQARRHDLVGFNLTLSPHSALSVNGELAFSQFDRNLFSKKDDADNQGLAFVINLNFQPQRFALLGRKLGQLAIRSRIRRKTADFQEIDRTTRVEFNRRWDLNSTAPSEETIDEWFVSYSPVTDLTFQGGLGRLSKSKAFKSNRWEFQAALKRKNWPQIEYFVENIARTDRTQSQENRWLRQRGHAEYPLKYLLPLFDYEGEIKKDTQNDTGQVGFRFDSYTGGLQLIPWKKLSASVRFNYRNDKDRAAGRFVPASIAKTQSYGWQLKNWRALSISASYTHRNRDFAAADMQDTRTDLADFRIGFAPRQRGIRSQVYYQISNTQVARQEELFIKVGDGEGNFRRNEELGEFEPDPFGDHIRQIVATKDFIPVVELRLRTDLKLQPVKFFRASDKKNNTGFLKKLITPLSTESFLRIDERTREKDVANIYLLKLSHFQQDSTTIFGSTEIRQDVHLWENSRKFSVRYRFRNRQDKNNQFVDGGQDRKLREQQFRIFHQLTKQISTKLEFIHTREDRIFKSLNRESRKIRANEMNLDLVYRPQSRWEIGLKSQFSFNRDIFKNPNTEASLISFAPRSTYSLNRKGRFRGELTWTKVSVAPKDRLIPFELTDGRRAGISFRWNLGFDLRVGQNIQASLSYFGRDEPDRPKVQHFAKVEMRAFF